ncbi:GntR family transcriptional regulator [Vibrio artabrorum]|uniref:GntR family transcriptional regulator n=1 Tax=Vibrio artabrorum TaxID=446374 RepID=UPI003551F67E
MNKPRYLQIADTLREKIKSGELPVGSILPTESELQTKFDVSRVTIRKAMQLLVENDLLYRQRGSGTYVKAPRAQHNVLQLTGFVEEVSAQGKTPSSKIITFELLDCTQPIAKKLNLEVGSEVYSIRRLRLINDEPEVLEHTYLPVALFPDLSIKAMRSSKYDYIEKTKNLKIKLSRQSMMPEIVQDSIAKELNMKSGEAVIRVDSVGELNDDQVFEYTIHYFRVNQYSFDYIAYREG